MTIDDATRETTRLGTSGHRRYVRTGFIGAGGMARYWLNAFRQVEAARVIAVADVLPEAAEKAAAKFGIPNVHAGLDICDRDDLDLICITTPDHLHAEPFVRALQAGKHVIVEKPLGNTMEDLHTMCAAARDSDRKVLVGHVLQFMPYFMQVKDLIDAGEVGEVFYLEADYIHNLRGQAHPSRFNSAIGMNWWLQEEKPMVGGGTHPLGALSWFLNSPPVEVQAYSHRLVFPQMVHDASMVAIFRFACGAIAKVTALYWCVTPYAEANHLAVYGTKATIRRQAICRSEKDGFVPLPVRWGGGKPMVAEVEHMIGCILNDREPKVGCIEGAQAAVAGIMAEEAAQKRCAVPIPTFDEYRRVAQKGTMR